MNEFAAWHMPRRAQSHQHVNREVGAAVEWSVFGVGATGQPRGVAPVMAGSVGLMVGYSSFFSGRSVLTG